MNSRSTFLALPSAISLIVLSVVFGASSGLQPERAPIQSKELKPGQTSPQTRSGEFQEDLNSIDVKDSKFPPVQVTLLERTEGKNAVYFSEHLRVTFRPGDPQDLYVILPAALKNPPVVLYIYSYPETVARFQMEQWALSAVAQGYAAIGFSSGIMGDATNHDLSREKFLIQFPQNLLRAAHDIQLVLNYLATRGDLNLAAVGMYAAGSGGSAGILASAADSRIKVLDVFGPWGAWPEFFANSSIIPLGKRDTFLKPEYLQSLAKFDPVAWFPKCRARSVRIQDVRQQDLVPGGAQQKIEDAAPDFAEVNQFEDSRVLLEMQGAGRVFGWTQAQLRPDAKPQTVAEKSKRIHYYAGKGHTIAE